MVALGGCLIVSVVAAFIEYGFALSDVKIQTSFVRYGVTDVFQNCFTVTFFLVLLYDIIAPAHYFSEIYSKRACDSYFAAPIKRADRFNAAFIMGAVVNIAAPLFPAATFFAFKFGGVPDKFAFSIDAELVNYYTVFVCCRFAFGLGGVYALRSNCGQACAISCALRNFVFICACFGAWRGFKA